MLNEESKFYTDLNLHVETQNYDDGETVSIKIKNPTLNTLSYRKEFLEVIAIIKNNKAIIANVFGDERKLILNEGENVN